MKLISFSVWGTDPVYTEGALANIVEAREHYPGWTCRYYLPKGHFLAERLAAAGAQVFPMAWNKTNISYFWRFFAAAEPALEYAIFRDCDSRVNSREAGAVGAWIDSGKDAHLMKDAPPHAHEIMLAGMWGVRGGVLRNIQALVEKWFREVTPGDKYDDQRFLKRFVWPLLQGSFICHGLNSPTGPGLSFPVHRPMKFGEYVGQVIQLPQ